MTSVFYTGYGLYANRSLFLALAMDPALVKYNSMLSPHPNWLQSSLCQSAANAMLHSLSCDATGTLADATLLDMSANRWKYFRWTPRTALITFMYVVAVPSAIGYLGFVTDVSCARPAIMASRRGKTLGMKVHGTLSISLC